MPRLCLSLLVVIAGVLPGAAFALSVDDYGQLPAIRSVSISPDGRYIAFIRGTVEGDFFVVSNLETHEMIGGARADKFKARSISFATNNHVILKGSQTQRSIQVLGKWESRAASVYSIDTKTMHPMMRGNDILYDVQSPRGRIVGILPDEGVALMPAYLGNGRATSYGLLKVSLDTGKAEMLERGNRHVIDWFVDAKGNAVARAEFNGQRGEYQIFSKTSGEWKRIYTQETERPDLALVALTQDGKHLIYNAYEEDDNSALFHMSLDDGATSGPYYAAPDRDIDRVLLSDNRMFEGVAYSGLLPEYKYVDTSMNDYVAAVQSLYPGSAVSPISATDDHAKIVFVVSGPGAARDYMLYDSKANSIARIGSAYPGVSEDQIGDVAAMRYRARDELPINAVITWPVGVEKAERKALPMLVFPHGGPEAYDSIKFNWWAQYFARRGYAVMQPNFRGSTGSGIEFREAGHGKWGAEMQHDISDGVAAMIAAGYADPDRICIMGASYGGYAALAGGAFTPELYRCIVAVAGVSDLPRMLKDTRHRSGRSHWVVSYWTELIGDIKAEKEKLKRISPVNYPWQFQAPVLLLHGKDDTVVPIRQSKIMAKALKKARKPVEMVSLKGEDHWLSTSATRLELLEKIDDFLRRHNPP